MQTTFNFGPNSYTVREFIGCYAVAWCNQTRDFSVFDEIEFEMVSEGHRTRAEACTAATLLAYPLDEPAAAVEGFSALGSLDSQDLTEAAHAQF